jgi:glycerol-3-phosphate dehydrogenase
MAEDQFFTIHPRKGTDSILDKAMTPAYRPYRDYRLSQIRRGKTTHSKGGGLIPTIDKNILVGPDAIEIPDREDYTTKSKASTRFSANTRHDRLPFGAGHHHLFLGHPSRDLRRGFRRPKRQMDRRTSSTPPEFNPRALPRLPAIGEDIALWASQCSTSKKEHSFNPKRPGIVKTRFLNDEERDALIKKNPAYGHIICRCEEISEGEIIDAIHSPIPARPPSMASSAGSEREWDAAKAASASRASSLCSPKKSQRDIYRHCKKRRRQTFLWLNQGGQINDRL